jgi:hypothetical protein
VGLYVELCNMQPWKMPGEGHVFLLFQLCIWFSNVCTDLYPCYKISSFTCNHKKGEKKLFKVRKKKWYKVSQNQPKKKAQKKSKKSPKKIG